MQTFLRKISSRKLWAAIVGVIVGIASAFGIDSSEYAPIVGVIGAIVSCVAYIVGESHIDAANASGTTVQTFTLPEDDSAEGLGVTETEYEK